MNDKNKSSRTRSNSNQRNQRNNHHRASDPREKQAMNDYHMTSEDELEQASHAFKRAIHNPKAAEAKDWEFHPLPAAKMTP